MRRFFAVAITVLLLSATARLFAADPAPAAPTQGDIVVDFSDINLAPAYAQKPMGQWLVGGGAFYKDDWGLTLAGGYQFNNGVAVLGQILGQDSPFGSAPFKKCRVTCPGCPEGDDWGAEVLVLVPLQKLLGK